MAAQQNSSLSEVPPLLDHSSLAIVADLVRFYLPCRELVRLQVVSREWRNWCSENAKLLWKARKQDAMSLEWYFPTGLSRYMVQRLTPELVLWYGIHHPSMEELRLPDLALGLRNCHINNVKILTSASGLLLLYTRRNWESELVVCNPLTKKWRNLPQLDPKLNQKLRGVGSYNSDVVIHIVVDDDFNTYEVVIIERLCVWTYNSKTIQWNSISPVSTLQPLTIGSTCCDGRVYLLEIGQGEEDKKAAVRVYLVKSRRWLQPDSAIYTLYEESMYSSMFGEGQPHGPTLLTCLGHVYAIVPVIADQRTIRKRLGLRSPGEGWTFKTGIVRFEAHKLLGDLEKRFVYCDTLPLKVKIRMRFEEWSNLAVNPWSWYRCAAQGAVIWLACEKKLLQFDVVTRCCKWETVQLESVRRDSFSTFIYEPSFLIDP